MNANWKLFSGLAVFYVIMAVVYYYVGGEAVGSTGMILAACLAGMVGVYLGFYSPHSWWPLPVALSATAMSLGLIIGWWLTLIALGALVLSIIGMVTEYEKPSLESHN